MKDKKSDKSRKDERWDASREIYLAYRDAKKKLNTTNLLTHRTYKKLESALKQFMLAQTEALAKVDDENQIYNLVDAYKTFQAAKQEHDAAQEAFGEALADFRDKEIAYSIVIFKTLREDHKFSIRDLAVTFGIWDSKIQRWFKANKSDDLKEIYQDEYGINSDG